jgi:phosphoribosylamine--glycine ligase/phosphoribosylformylglycinamidine cyclo-ligase
MFFRKDIGQKGLKHFDSKSMTYADSGVCIERGNKFVENIKKLTSKTKRPGSDAIIGGFGGAFDIKKAGYSNDAMLIAATDGVGTKLKIAHIMKKHDTIGIDLVAMNVNDLIVQGAEPLFFLDYFACGHLNLDISQQVVKGIADGCIEAGCALVGGETAEMPGLYTGEDYDLAGFSVGAVESLNILPKTASKGDIVLGLESSGIHSNGFSLVRHIIKNNGIDYNFPCPWNPDISLGLALLTPTRIYVRQLLPLVKSGLIKCMAHITGGGFIDNIPRVLDSTKTVVLDSSKWKLPEIFKWLKKEGNLTDCNSIINFRRTGSYVQLWNWYGFNYFSFSF